jgi:CBS domain-containing protein
MLTGTPLPTGSGKQWLADRWSRCYHLGRTIDPVRQQRRSDGVKVVQVLDANAKQMVTIKPSETVARLCEVLAAARVGAAVVTTDGTRIEGVITERDITFGLAKHGQALLAIPVASIMTSNVITCAAEDDVGQVASTMLSRGFRHIPVQGNGRPVGMVSIRDVLQSRVDELNQQTALLRSYANSAMAPIEDR